MKDLSGKVSSLEVTNTRLESQVDNLIESLGKLKNERINSRPTEKETVGEEVPAFVPTGRRSDDQGYSKEIKCKHNDRATCHRGENCFFLHSQVVCKMFSKYGECEDQEHCLKRHPVGFCSRWKRGRCDRNIEDCPFRHPVEVQSPPRRSHRSPDKLDERGARKSPPRRSHRSPDRLDERGSRKRRNSSHQEDVVKSARLNYPENLVVCVAVRG